MRNKVIIKVLILFNLLGCDCAYDYEYTMINKLDKPILVKYMSENNTQDSFIIYPEVSQILYSGFGHYCGCTSGCEAERERTVDSTLSHIRNIQVFQQDTISSITNFNKEKNWDFESKKKLGLYKAYIDMNDF